MEYNIFQNIKNNIFLFMVVFCGILFKIKSFRYIKPFPISSNHSLLISDEGIYKFSDFGNYNLTQSFNSGVITDYSDFQYISFAQSTYSEKYIFCKVNEKIYFISSDAENVYDIVSIEEISQTIVELIPYKDQNNFYYLNICFINSDKKLKIIKYKINDTNKLVFLDSKIEEIIENNQTQGLSLYSGVSCQVMYYQNYSYDLLTCFVEKNNYKLIAMIFDLENGLNFTFSTSFEYSNKGTFYIKSEISSDKKKSLICIPQLSNNLQCFFYNSENIKFSESIELYPNCTKFDFGIIYLSENNEFYTYCNSNKDNSIFYLVKFEEEFNIHEIKQNGICYQLYEGSMCNNKSSTFIYYNKKENSFMEMLSCYNYNTDFYYNVKFDYICNSQLNFTIDNIFTTIVTILESTSMSYLPELTTIPLTNSITQLSPTTGIFNEKNGILDTTIFSPTNIIVENDSILATIIKISENTANYKEDNDFEYFIEKDIYIGKISNSKEELEKNIDKLIKKIEIGKKYEIYGDDYNVTISPVNEVNLFKSTYIDFTLCEEVLRKECHLSPNEILTILQIEIDKIDEKTLTNQIEYAIYDEDKTKLNLSYCKNVEIKITYEIKDESVLNKSMISYYSDLGIDIFDINDSFFNDICYPFFISDSDIILKDRVLDIYQNYSVCDNNCDYEQFNIENMSVVCSCQVKTEINTIVSKPTYGGIIIDTFTNSNFGVIKCYKLVFSSNNKIYNIGFLIFVILLIFNIFLFIYYFIFQIKSIQIFVYKEMEINKYITINNFPIKKIKDKIQ